MDEAGAQPAGACRGMPGAWGAGVERTGARERARATAVAAIGWDQGVARPARLELTTFRSAT